MYDFKGELGERLILGTALSMVRFRGPGLSLA
jgi:hypothetical protein